ncbi:protease complex subunit PrcB family protein [Lysinibacillus sp. BW-2-10]|uniref:protease complex subunit PrcB family protein n=1 Tax=Lysinibacillus sp. BW-2-10 TaxID=2590030 RepID=UPI00117E2689|nr:protease complex subunit PrcB family protein [Lysinibacillus sp. BW-2-10]TSI11052.1 protease complex subunit PrcB family protein [Lysinibacillus sp. BW-2-10]
MKQSMLILSALMAVSMMTPVEKASANEERLQTNVPQVVTDESLLHFSPVETNTLTAAERDFVEEAKKKEPGIYHLGTLYVITLGEKPTTGYDIKLVESKTTLGKEQIFVEMTTADIGGDAITYPHLVGRLQLPSKYMTVEVIDAKTGKSAFETIKESFLHFTPVKTSTLSNEEKQFVEEAKTKKPGYYNLENLYVITLGEKPTTGYGIKFVDSQTTFEMEQIQVKLTKPDPEKVYSTVITHPYIVGRLDLPSKTMSIEVMDVETGKSAFEEKDPYTAVAINKEWTIRFNTKINEDTVTAENIYIYEKANGQPINKFPVRLTLLDDEQTVKVKPLASYKYGHEYKLFISKEVSSTKNIKMKADKEVAFTTIKAPEIEVPPAEPSMSFNYRFKGSDTQGWQGEFSDYEVDMEIEPIFKHAMLPPEIGKSLEGLYMSSSNRSDDVFMYIKKKLDETDGIKPNTTYQVNLSFDLVTNVGPDLAIGIGGSPGDAVYVKAGATTVEPKPVLEKKFYRTNIDYGNQSEGGTDVAVLGNITKKSDGNLFELKPFEHKFEVTTDNNGELWIAIGTDSGFEGITSLYYTNINVQLTEK